MTLVCEHFATDPAVEPPSSVCAACIEAGASWVHLRQCLTCGRTSCCDLSPNRHASAHFRESGHPMIRSAEAGDDWSWCYEDDRLYETGAKADGAVA